MAAKTYFEDAARGKATFVVDAEDLLIAGVDDGPGAAPEAAHLVDRTNRARLRAILADPCAALSGEKPEDEDFQSLVISVATHGVEKPVEATKVTVGGVVVKFTVDGRTRVVAGRVANLILDKKLKAPPSFAQRFAAARGSDGLERVTIPVLAVKDDDPVELADRVHRSNLARRSYTAAQRYDLIAARAKAADKSGVEPDANAIATALGLGISEVKAALAVIRKGTPDVSRKVSAGTLTISAAAQVAALPQPKQAAALEALVASGDTTVAAAREASKAVRKGEDAAAAVKQKAERKGLSGREVADLLEAAKATATPDTLAVLRLIVEGPDALDAKTRRSLGLAPAIEAIERKRAGKA
jgi:hypothetical protein